MSFVVTACGRVNISLFAYEYRCGCAWFNIVNYINSFCDSLLTVIPNSTVSVYTLNMHTGTYSIVSDTVHLH